MQPGRRIADAATRAVLLLIFLPMIARACSVVYPTVKAGESFRARVTDRGRSIKGLRLVLTPGHGDAIYALTDKDGYARFANLNPGTFSLTSDHDAGVADAVNVDVTAGGSAGVTVVLRWPSRALLRVQSVHGVVRGPDYYPSQVQPQLSLSLLEGPSGRAIATVNADSKGRFDFAEQVPSGIYFLRLNPSGLTGWSGEQMSGLMAIEVDQKAKWTALDLDIGWTSCGLTYAQRTRYPEIDVSQVCGDIADNPGAVVANALVMLLAADDDTIVVAQARSGTNGQFAFQAQHVGAYYLLVRYPGFRPLMRLVHVTRARVSSSCRRPIHVRLDAMM